MEDGFWNPIFNLHITQIITCMHTSYILTPTYTHSSNSSFQTGSNVAGLVVDLNTLALLASSLIQFLMLPVFTFSLSFSFSEIMPTTQYGSLFPENGNSISSTIHQRLLAIKPLASMAGIPRALMSVPHSFNPAY